MARKAIKNTKVTGTLTLSECEDGFWLYDYTRGMNLSMRAKTPESAFVEAILYYQKRTNKVESELRDLKKAVGTFVEAVSEDENYIP